jgi:hypothetical protein
MKQLPVLIFALLLAIGAIGGYVFMLNSIQTAVDGIAVARADSEAATEREKLAQTANVFIAETVESRSELDTFVTKDANFVSAIEMMESAGKREKVEVEIGSVSVKKIDAKSHEVAAVILSAKGSFANLAAFASALESLPLSSRVVSVSLEASGENSWFAAFTLEFVKRKSL